MALETFKVQFFFGPNTSNAVKRFFRNAPYLGIFLYRDAMKRPEKFKGAKKLKLLVVGPNLAPRRFRGREMDSGGIPETFPNATMAY